MKKTFYLTILVCLFYVGNLKGQEIPNASEKINAVYDIDNLYSWGNFYFSGQPTLETIEYLHDQGVGMVINLRSTDENKKFTKESFDEKKATGRLSMNYYSIPMQGKEGFNPNTLAEFSKLIKVDHEKVLIHCKSGGRATLIMMAYLIKEHNYSLDEAKNFGSQLKYFDYLDALLSE